jgi:hypothetical protein
MAVSIPLVETFIVEFPKFCGQSLIDRGSQMTPPKNLGNFAIIVTGRRELINFILVFTLLLFSSGASAELPTSVLSFSLRATHESDPLNAARKVSACLPIEVYKFQELPAFLMWYN